MYYSLSSPYFSIFRFFFTITARELLVEPSGPFLYFCLRKIDCHYGRPPTGNLSFILFLSSVWSERERWTSYILTFSFVAFLFLAPHRAGSYICTSPFIYIHIYPSISHPYVFFPLISYIFFSVPYFFFISTYDFPQIDSIETEWLSECVRFVTKALNCPSILEAGVLYYSKPYINILYILIHHPNLLPEKELSSRSQCLLLVY